MSRACKWYDRFVEEELDVSDLVLGFLDLVEDMPTTETVDQSEALVDSEDGEDQDADDSFIDVGPDLEVLSERITKLKELLEMLDAEKESLTFTAKNTIKSGMKLVRLLKHLSSQTAL